MDERENSELKESVAANEGETESAAATAEAPESDVEVDGEDNADRGEKAEEEGDLLPLEGGRSAKEAVWMRPDLNGPPSPTDTMRRTPPLPPPPPPQSSGTKLHADVNTSALSLFLCGPGLYLFNSFKVLGDW